jgi:hypothetical protein
MPLRTDERGQSIGLSRFFMSVFLVGSILYFITSQVGKPMLKGAQNATTNATMNQGSTMLLDVVNLMPLIMLFVGFTGMIVLAVYQREVLR